MPISAAHRGVFSRDRDLSANAFTSLGEEAIFAALPWRHFLRRSSAVTRSFGPRTPLSGVNTPLPHSAPNVATSPFYKNPFFRALAFPRGPVFVLMRIQAHQGSSARMQLFFPQFGTYKGGGDYFFYNFAAVTPPATGGSPSLLRFVHARSV